MTPPRGQSVLPGPAGFGLRQRWVRYRLVGTAVVFTGVFGLLLCRAWAVQVRDHDFYLKWADWQHRVKVTVPSRRGRILDRNGAELAASVDVQSIYAEPGRIKLTLPEIERAASALERILHLPQGQAATKLLSSRQFVWIKRQVAPEEAREVRALKLRGVGFTTESRRYYPDRDLAGTLLGNVDLDGNGIDGLELSEDARLKGTPRTIQAVRDATGRHVMPAGALDPGEDKAGDDVVATIDRFLQHRLESALEEGVELHHAKAATGVMIDPRTGEVLAMASVPTVNPNDPHEKGARDRAVTDAYEPGSIMKTFSLTGAIEAGVTTPDEKWFCENGRWAIGRNVLHDAEPIGTVTTTEVLAKSSNICTSKIMRKLGRERLEAILRRFNFGKPTGIDLPGERSGVLRPSKDWRDIELATISFGQGVTVTPVQMAAAYAAIADGGVWIRPHVVKRVVDANGNLVEEVKPVRRRVVAPEVAATMRTMLHAVMEKGGTAEKLAIPEYPAGGKTGTAQKVDPATHRYSTEMWVSSFVGFAPLDDPRLVLLVMVDQPTGAHYGGEVAGPIWREVMLDSLRYLNVPPVAVAEDPAADAADAKKRRAANRGDKGRGEPAVTSADRGGVEMAADALDDSGDGAASDAPSGSASVAAGGANATAGVSARGGASAVRIPSFEGMTVGQALRAASGAGVSLYVLGTGRAVSQDPAPGPAGLGAGCRVRFAPDR